MNNEDLTEAELDWAAEQYARYFGYDPEGNWILVVHSDNSSEFFRFDDPKDMWCCKPNREKHYKQAITAVAPPFERASAPQHDPMIGGAGQPSEK